MKRGEVYICLVPYFDVINHRYSYKRRPILCLAYIENNDYLILNISTKNHSQYDIELAEDIAKSLGLNKTSYIRVNKPMTINEAQIRKRISNLNELYPELFERIIKTYKYCVNDKINEL